MDEIQKIHITKEKIKELEQELENISTEGRTVMAERLDTAKAMGDLKENAEYHQARDDQGMLEERIKHIQYVLKNAVVVSGEKKETVEIGAHVTIAKKGSSIKTEYTIVGPEEVNPDEGKLSKDSPLVAAMWSKKEGEDFSFTTPGGDVIEWKITDIK